MARCGEHLHAAYFRPVLELASERLGVARTHEILRQLGTTPAMFADPSCWVSVGFADELLCAFVDASADPHFVAHAYSRVHRGRYLWLLRPLIRFLGSPQSAFAQLASGLPAYNRIGTLEVLDEADEHVTLAYTSTRDAPAALCQGRIGRFVQVPTLFGATPAQVAHPECLHRGGTRCVYVVRWQMPRPWWIRWPVAAVQWIAATIARSRRRLPHGTAAPCDKAGPRRRPLPPLPGHESETSRLLR